MKKERQIREIVNMKIYSSRGRKKRQYRKKEKKRRKIERKKEKKIKMLTRKKTEEIANAQTT